MSTCHSGAVKQQYGSADSAGKAQQPATGAVEIRPARPEDRDAIIDICRLTGDAGLDATPRLQNPDLMGQVWAEPYLVIAPEFALVAVTETGDVAGYAVGALDTVAFETACDERWWPALREQYPLELTEQFSGDLLDPHLIRRIHTAPRTDPELCATWPSHLHVDLLPSLQGRGVGRRIMADLVGLLKVAGSPGVHLGVDPRNTGALAFYPRIGFERWRPDSTMFVRSL